MRLVNGEVRVFKLYVCDAGNNLDAVMEKISGSKVDVIAVAKKPAGPYGDEWSRVCLDICTATEEEARQLRREVGACYMGVGSGVYSVGDEYYKRNRLVKGEYKMPKKKDMPPSYGSKVGDIVNHPAHYTFGEVECIDAIHASMSEDEFVGYLKGQVIKYIWRAGRKDAGKRKEDLEKARWYLDKYIEVAS